MTTRSTARPLRSAACVCHGPNRRIGCETQCEVLSRAQVSVSSRSWSLAMPRDPAEQLERSTTGSWPSLSSASRRRPGTMARCPPHAACVVITFAIRAAARRPRAARGTVVARRLVRRRRSNPRSSCAANVATASAIRIVERRRPVARRIVTSSVDVNAGDQPRPKRRAPTPPVQRAAFPQAAQPPLTFSSSTVATSSMLRGLRNV